MIAHEPPNKMPFYYAAADVLIITSNHEGSSNCLKEAMACNLPVVSTACGDAAERLREVDPASICPRDPHLLGESLVEIIQKGQRSGGRAHLSELDSGSVAHRVLGVYRRILNGHSNDERSPLR